MTEVTDGLGRCLLLASVFVVTVALLTGTAAAQSAPDCSTISYNGAGTEANPYEVGDVDQLQCIKNQSLSASYEVVSDIDASETASWNNGKGFEPIGERDHHKRGTRFNGTFDGQDHNITGLTIDRGSEEDVGLFGFVNLNGTVTNVGVADADINGSEKVGALVGVNWGTVNDSYATGDITGSGSGSGSGVGGLVGANVGVSTYSEGTIRDSYSTADVRGSNFVGSLVGTNTQGNVTESYATGAANGSRNVGGLVGGNSGTITESYATGTANGSKNVGGLTGVNRGGTIKESYAMGSIEGTEYERERFVDGQMGGLVGANEWGSSISESYATGSVNGPPYLGGLVGSNGGTVNESYWDVQATGQSKSAGNGTGLNTSKMTGSAARGNMTGFNFTSTWETVTNPDDYPVLAWQDVSRGASRNGNRNTMSGESNNSGDGTDDGGNRSTGGEGLPGFTVMAVLLALLIVVAAAVSRRTE